MMIFETQSYQVVQVMVAVMMRGKRSHVEQQEVVVGKLVQMSFVEWEPKDWRQYIYTVAMGGCLKERFLRPGLFLSSFKISELCFKMAFLAFFLRNNFLRQ